ncbi:DoxX family protein [Bordetella trematum]|uniref:DoxX family protein n=1 Tax=Bordetella trematum TaxID=123899 RepID=UPI000D9A4DE1|nr:DoxX family protein [Bordetella trematum]SPU49564.1 membrane protein [Bordetella trematum]VDH05419.1 DoxX [Bordetella trematum]
MCFLSSWRAKVDEAGLGLLLLRLWVGMEFLRAGWVKLGGGWQAPQWFRELSFPWPQSWLAADFNWVAAGGLEIVFGLALILGVGVRWASAVLLYVVYVAVAAVHFDLGWAGWNQIETEDGQGFKVPLMLALMLLVLLTQGGGRYGLGRLCCARCKRNG